MGLFMEALKVGGSVLKAAGDLGVEVIKEAGKASGKLVAEGTKGARYAIGDALGLTQSNADTQHHYLAWTLDDLQADKDYINQFSAAIDEIFRIRVSNGYVDRYFVSVVGLGSERKACSKACLLDVDVGDEGVKKTTWRLYFGKVIDRRGYDETSERLHSVVLVLHTPNAKQLTWNGGRLQKGYSIVQGKERGTRLENQNISPIDSFLGIKFLADFKVYTNSGDPSVKYDLGLDTVETGKANKFLDFDSYRLIVVTSSSNHLSGRIVGVVCAMNTAKINNVYYSDQRMKVHQFMKKIRAILEHKYRSTWTRSSETLLDSDPRMHYMMDVGCLIDGDHHMVRIDLGLSENSDFVELKVIVYDVYQSVYNEAYSMTSEYRDKVAKEEREAEMARKQAEAEERKRKEAEEKAAAEAKARIEAAEKAKRARKEAIAAKKAELNNALDAL